MRLKLFFLPLSIVIALIVTIWFLKPEWDVLKSKKKELKTQEEKLKSVTDKADSLQRALNDYQGIGSAEELINNAIPRANDNEELISEVNKFVHSQGLFLSSISLEQDRIEVIQPAQQTAAEIKEELQNPNVAALASAGAPPVSQINAQLSLFGDYVAIKNFIHSLGQTNRYVKITGVSLSSAVKKEETEELKTGLVNAQVSLTTFYKTEDLSVKLSQMIFSKDIVVESLLKGQISEAVIENFEANRTASAYRLEAGSVGSGKENLFIGNTAQTANPQ